MVQNSVRGRLFGVSDHLRRMARGSSRDGGVGLVIECWKMLFNVVYEHLSNGKAMSISGLGTFFPCLETSKDVALDLDSGFLAKCQVSYRKDVKKVPAAMVAHPVSFTEIAMKCDMKRDVAADILVGLLESVKEDVARGELTGLDMFPVGALLFENRQARFLSAKLKVQEQPAQEPAKAVKRETITTSDRRQEEMKYWSMSTSDRSKMGQTSFLIQRMKDAISRQFSSSDDVFAFFTNDNSTITVEQLISGIRKIADVADDELASFRKQVQKQHGSVLHKSDFEKLLNLDKLSQKELLCFKCIYDAVYIAKSTLKEIFQLADRDVDGKVSLEELAAVMSEVASIDRTEVKRSLDILSKSYLERQGLSWDLKRKWSYAELASMLEGHTRPFDWEQEVLLRCQRWMVQHGYSLEQAFSLIAGGSRSGISRKRFGEWILQIDPLLYLEHVDRIFNKFKLVDGEIRKADFTSRLNGIVLQMQEKAFRWLEDKLFEKKKTLQALLIESDFNRDGKVSSEEFLRMVKMLDRSLSEAEAREFVKALTLTELQDNVDVLKLQKRFDHHNVQSSEADANLLESIQKALISRKISPKSFFDKFDRDRDSRLSEVELTEGLQSLGVSCSKHQVRKLMYLTDKDSNGFLDIDEFVGRFGLESVKKSDKFAHLATKLSLYLSKLGYTGAEQVFKKFAKQDFIGFQEFRSLIQHARVKMSVEEEDVMWRTLDVNNRGRLNLRQFISSMSVGAFKMSSSSHLRGDQGGSAVDAARMIKDIAHARRQTISDLFVKIDKDNDGYVGIEDLDKFAPEVASFSLSSQRSKSKAVKADVAQRDLAGLLRGTNKLFLDQHEFVRLIEKFVPNVPVEQAILYVQEQLLKTAKGAKLKSAPVKVHKNEIQDMLRGGGFDAEAFDQLLDMLGKDHDGNVVVPTIVPLDWREVKRLMHHIGTSLSRRFGSADALLQKLPPPAGATATAAQNKSYNFASMVDLVEDGGIMNKKQLAATHWDQICERLGGKSGTMSEETIRNLMTTYDFRIELMNELQDAVYDGGHRPEDLLRKKEFGRDDFCNLYCSLLKSRTISEATLLFDWLTSSQRSKHSLTRAQLVNLLFGYDKPLDWEREKLAELSVDIRASFRTVDEFLKILDLDKDGTVSVKELQSGFSNVNMRLTKRDVRLLFLAIDEDGSGDLDVEELRKVFYDAESKESRGESIQVGRDDRKRAMEDRWARLRRVRLARLLANFFPDVSSAFRALQNAGPALRNQQGVSAAQFTSGFTRIFEEAKIAAPSAEKLLQIFKAAVKDALVMSFSQFASLFWQGSKEESKQLLPSQGLKNAIESMKRKEQAIMKRLEGQGRIRRTQLVEVLQACDLKFDQETLQQILDFAGQGHGTIDVPALLRACQRK
uniref:EF-hand domain-containing protein n=1 Tax=Guillardia theta TaxID=55529 RepID=A0A7S4H9Y5_GUITH